MAAQFDGVNLIITLDPPTAGVLEQDVEQIYDDAKQWHLNANNRKYPFPFRTTGGDPLTSIINQGAYYFLRNDYGWRIKTTEEDQTVYLVGNLAVQDTTLEAFNPTDGDFTVAVIGLQPVTQGVTPAMAGQLEFNVFSGMVCVDPINGFAGTGYEGNDPIGTRKAPSNNMTDALTIAGNYGLNIFNFLNDETITGGDFSAGFEFRADSLSTLLTINAAANVSGCTASNITVAGEFDGLNRLEKCDVSAVSAISGQITECDLNSTIGINGNIHITSCYSGIAALGYPTITGIGASEVVVRNMRGSLGVAGMTGGSHSIGVYGGRLVVEASCSGGTIYVRGDPYEITDLSGGSVTLIDQTDSQKLTEIWTRLGLEPGNPITDTPGGIDSQSGNIDINRTGDGETSSTLTRQ